MKYKLIKAFPGHDAVGSIYSTDVPGSTIKYAEFPEFFEYIKERSTVDFNMLDYNHEEDYGHMAVFAYKNHDKQKCHLELMRDVHKYGEITFGEFCYGFKMDFTDIDITLRPHKFSLWYEKIQYMFYEKTVSPPWLYIPIDCTDEQIKFRRKLIFNFIQYS